jgi:lipoprotein-anchoring transpeptidase ErfK/SrfK
MFKCAFAAAVLAAVGMAGGVAPVFAQGLTLETVNAAEFSPKRGKGASPTFLRAQVLLDRARFSPGAIDGRDGENLRKALAAFERDRGLKADGKLDKETWAKLIETSAEPALIEYEITKADLKGPFTEAIPSKMEEMAELDRLSYTSPLELLAEKFHMTEELLKELNPRKRFDEAGTKIAVANVLADPTKDATLQRGRVKRIEVEKRARVLKAYDKDGKLVAFSPASVGSTAKPAPSGSYKVQGVAENPVYTYDPEFAFKGVKAEKKLTIKPGPNNPVGSIWIDVSLPTYGIHGTAEPRKVGKSYSHGCVRLTNWDAKQLALMVDKGTSVDFVD